VCLAQPSGNIIACRAVTFLIGKVVKKWGSRGWQLEAARTHSQRVGKETLESNPNWLCCGLWSAWQGSDASADMKFGFKQAFGRLPLVLGHTRLISNRCQFWQHLWDSPKQEIKTNFSKSRRSREASSRRTLRPNLKVRICVTRQDKFCF
jgi:hypothetical protein